MHLFVVRVPALDGVYHLHPDETGAGRFRVALPPMEAGRHRLYADVVHTTGLPETPVGEIELPAIAGAQPGPDDGWANVPALNAAGARESPLTSGEPPPARKLGRLRPRVLDEDRQPKRVLGLYMGTLGHAAIVAHDGTVFAHLHPSGSVPMGALAVAGVDTHAMHAAGGDGELPSDVAFPYAFPKAGAYRLFVQVRRAGKIETGVFDVVVR